MSVNRLFQHAIEVINVGQAFFADELEKAGVKVQRVEWKPPAGGNEKIIGLLDRIKKAKKATA